MSTSDWQEKSLEELGKITSSKRIFKKEYVDIGVPFYRTKEVKELAAGGKVSTELYISEERYAEIVERNGVPQTGDLLLTAIGTIGEIYVVKNSSPFYFKDGNVLWLKDFHDVDSSYLKYALIGFVDELKRLSRGAAYNALPIERLKKHKIQLPSELQQKRIVAKIEELFSHIDAGIAALNQTKQLLKQYRQSVLKAAVTGELTKEWRKENDVSLDETWRSITIGECTEVIDPNPSHRYPPYDNGDVPLLATKQMEGEDEWDVTTAKLTTSDFYEQRKAAHGFDEEDIIFARKGRLGLARRPPISERYAFSHTVFIVRGNKQEVDSSYLLWVLRREEAVSWLLKEMNVGAGVPTLGKAIFNKLPFQLPGLREQKTITELIEDRLLKISRADNSIKEQVLKAQKTKQSILAAAFSGKLKTD